MKDEMSECKHKWKSESIGEYDELFRCKLCGKTHMESADNPSTWIKRAIDFNKIKAKSLDEILSRPVTTWSASDCLHVAGYASRAAEQSSEQSKQQQLELLDEVFNLAVLYGSTRQLKNGDIDNFIMYGDFMDGINSLRQRIQEGE